MLFTGKNVLLVSHRPTALVQVLAHSLAAQGAHVTLALRHSQDGRYAVKRILKQLQPHTNAVAANDPVTSPRLDSGKQPLNMASLASIHAFAEGLNNSDVPLDLVFIDTWDLYAAGTKDRRWYTLQGLAGTAQTGFIGPAVLLHLLQPKLAECGTAVLLTASPNHRLASLELDDLQTTLTSWGHSTLAANQAALLAYVRRLATQLHSQGVKAAAVDLSVLSEQPLKGSLIRKLPVLHQALHILLPSAHDAAHLLVNVAGHLLAPNATPMPQTAPASVTDSMQPAAQEASVAQGPSTGIAGEPLLDVSEAPAQAVNTAVEAEEPQAILEPEVPAPALAASPAGPMQQDDRPDFSMDPMHDAAGAFDASAESCQAAALDMGRSYGFDKPSEPHAATGEDASSAVHTQMATGSSGGLINMQGLAAAAGNAVSTVRDSMAPVGSGMQYAATAAASSFMNTSGAAGYDGIGNKPFSYISRGLLASPLITALDHAGSSTWATRTLHTLTTPIYDLVSTSLITAASLADWPTRALLLGPAGLLPSLMSHLGPAGARGTRMVSQLQGLVPGVVGVPPDSPPGWVEVQPSGAVLDDKVGWRLWHLVEGYAGMHSS